jgi:hypothetical protein
MGVVVKGFVKIAQPEENDSIGMLAFDIKVLLAGGGDFGFCHIG